MTLLTYLKLLRFSGISNFAVYSYGFVCEQYITFQNNRTEMCSINVKVYEDTVHRLQPQCYSETIP